MVATLAKRAHGCEQEADGVSYAIHGYPFRRADLRAASCRELPVLGNEQDQLEYGMDQRFRIAAPNPFYSDALLDEDDRAYLAAIAAEQARRAAASPAR